MPPKEKLKKKSSSVASDSGKKSKGKKSSGSSDDKTSKGVSKGASKGKDKSKSKGKAVSEGGSKGVKGKSKGKGKGKSKEEQASEDEANLLEAPSDTHTHAVLGVMGRLLERYCCCRSAAKIAFEEKQREERERRAAEEEEAARVAQEERERAITRGDIPIKELKKYIREYTKEYEHDFWLSIMDHAVDKRVKHAAATRIQTMVRAFVGPCRRRRLVMTAYSEVDEFWDMKRAEKLHAKDLEKIEIATRASFSLTYTRNAFNAVVSKKARNDGAYLIQRAWRGYVGRSIFRYFIMLARELRIKKEKPPKSRFTSEVFKRVWGRKKYEPKGGWPGKADVIEVCVCVCVTYCLMDAVA
jgi:hypothetical protein